MLQPNFSQFPLISTSRLLLGPIQQQHAADMFDMRSKEKVMQYIGRDKFKTIEEAAALIKVIEETLYKYDGINWRISLKDAPEKLIGTCGLWRLIKENYRAEIGYMLQPDFWGKGIMKEAIEAVIDFGFNNIGLHSIEAHINPMNEASAAVLEKTGFVREAYFKEDYFYNGQFSDTAVYSILNKK